MDDYKLAIILKEDEDKNFTDGEVIKIGNFHDPDELHVECLLDFVRKNFPENNYLKSVGRYHRPEVIAYGLTQLGYIVFFNCTSFRRGSKETFPKEGFFMLPDEISEQQKESLLDFSKDISNYSTTVNYEFRIDEDGMLDGKTLNSPKSTTPEELLNKYFESKKAKSR